MHPHYCCSSSRFKKLISCLAANMPRSTCWVQGRLLTERGSFCGASAGPHITLPRGAQFLSKELTKPRTSNHEGSVLCLTGLGKRDLPNCSLRTARNNPATLSLKSEQPRAKRLDCLCKKQSSVSLHQPHETSFYQNSLKHAIMCSF